MLSGRDPLDISDWANNSVFARSQMPSGRERGDYHEELPKRFSSLLDAQ